jgi:hypothetical protein
MSKTNTWENELLLLLFNNTTMSGVGDVTGLPGSAVAGSLYVSLHTADPGEGGSQNTNEAAYTAYARVAVARTVGGWTVSANAVENAALIAFPQCAGGSSTVTHFGIGTESSGAGKLLYKGELTPTIAITTGITPQIPASGIDITED